MLRFIKEVPVKETKQKKSLLQNDSFRKQLPPKKANFKEPKGNGSFVCFCSIFTEDAQGWGRTT